MILSWLCDAWAAFQMGYSLESIPYIGAAEQLRIGSADISAARVRELNHDDMDCHASPPFPPTGKVRELAPYITEDSACSACYASLIFALSRMNQPKLNRLKEKICVGQGFQGKAGNVGIGQCCAGFRRFCRGCPPSGADVLAFLGG